MSIAPHFQDREWQLANLMAYALSTAVSQMRDTFTMDDLDDNGNLAGPARAIWRRASKERRFYMTKAHVIERRYAKQAIGLDDGNR